MLGDEKAVNCWIPEARTTIRRVKVVIPLTETALLPVKAAILFTGMALLPIKMAILLTGMMLLPVKMAVLLTGMVLLPVKMAVLFTGMVLLPVEMAVLQAGMGFSGRKRALLSVGMGFAGLNGAVRLAETGLADLPAGQPVWLLRCRTRAGRREQGTIGPLTPDGNAISVSPDPASCRIVRPSCIGNVAVLNHSAKVRQPKFSRNLMTDARPPQRRRENKTAAAVTCDGW